MEAKNVQIYSNNFINYEKRTYQFYQNTFEKIDLMDFLDNLDNDEISTPKIYGINNNIRMKEYSVIFTFYNSDSDNNYIVFTDNMKDQENKTIFFAALYNENNQEPFIGYPTTKSEWNDIITITDSIFFIRH